MKTNYLFSQLLLQKICCHPSPECRSFLWLAGSKVRGMVRHRRAGVKGALPESVNPDIIVPRYQALRSGRHCCWPAAIRSR